MKWVLIVLASVFGLSVACCLLGVLVALPTMRNEVQDAVQDGVATEVAEQIPAVAGIGAEPGTYTITEQELQQRLRDNADDNDGNDPVVRITTTEVRIGVQTRGGDATYTGVPAAEDGRFVMNDMHTDSRVLRFILAPSDLGDAISDAVNSYLATNGLRLDSVELQDGQLVLVTTSS